jgi:hypothetical protein
MTTRFVQAVLLLNGLSYAAIGLVLLLAPEWFFIHVGTFPPFNRHYEGDLGGFLVALGAGLLYAVRHPAAQLGVLGVAAAGGTLHALNHVVDALGGAGGWDQVFALLVLAALTLAAVWQVARRHALTSG